MVSTVLHRACLVGLTAKPLVLKNCKEYQQLQFPKLKKQENLHLYLHEFTSPITGSSLFFCIFYNWFQSHIWFFVLDLLVKRDRKAEEIIEGSEGRRKQTFPFSFKPEKSGTFWWCWGKVCVGPTYLIVSPSTPDSGKKCKSQQIRCFREFSCSIKQGSFFIQESWSGWLGPHFYPAVSAALLSAATLIHFLNTNKAPRLTSSPLPHHQKFQVGFWRLSLVLSASSEAGCAHFKGMEDDSKQKEEVVEEEEYVLLDLDSVYGQMNIPPNTPYVLSGLDTLNPVLVIGDNMKLIGEYDETVGTCYVFTETDVPVVHEEFGPSETNLFRGKCIVDPNQPSRKQVQPIASLHKILKFRLLSEVQAQSTTTAKFK